MVNGNTKPWPWDLHSYINMAEKFLTHWAHEILD